MENNILCYIKRMGVKRFLYNLFGIEYIGTSEQIMIDKMKHQKYLVCTQIRHSNIKLKSIYKKEEPKTTVNKKRFNYSRNKKFMFRKNLDY